MKLVNLAPPLEAERIVKPRKPYSVDPVFMCWDEDSETVLYDERPGVSWGLVECCKWLWKAGSWPRTNRNGKRRQVILVCRNTHSAYLRLHQTFSHHPGWNDSLKHQDTEVYGRDGKMHKPKVKTSKGDHIGFMGFTSDGKRSNHYIWPVSPLDFIDEFDAYCEGSPEIERLYYFARDVTQFVTENNLRFSTTRGGLAAQLLRDSRFYPNPRRKVPMKTNEKSRQALPGNFVMWKRNTLARRIITKVYEVDQQNSHHYCAENVPLPNADTLFAHGRFLTETDRPYIHSGHWKFDQLLGEYGLFRLGVLVPKYLQGYLPQWARPSNVTVRDVYVYSNELPLLHQLGIDIRYISYCWTSPKTDSGLPQYARWAKEQIADCHPNRKLWLKPALVSAYGLLGTRPRHLEYAYWQTQNTRAQPEVYWFGPTPVTLQKLVSTHEVQPVFANVIQRGMIEAETRKLTCELARELERDGHDVIAVHSDALHIRDEGQQLPLLPPPWRLKRTLTNYARLDDVSYESDQVVCTPGRSNGKAAREKRRAKTLR